jgi:pilus assembly protein CpaE
MLRGIIITPNIELGARLEEVAEYTGAVQIMRSVDHYLDGEELERLMRSQVPEVVFLSVESLALALESVKYIERAVPGVQVVGIERAAAPSVLLDLMRAGIREFIAYPFDPNPFVEMMGRVSQAASSNPVRMQLSDSVFSFLPAKAGCGTSTIALNTALTFSKMKATKTLMVDLDLNSGLLGFMLKLDTQVSIYDAAEHAANLDEHLWPQLITKKGPLDVICSGRLDPRMRIEGAQVRAIISFARRFYRSICIDMSGNMEKYSIDIMQESKRIFVVCTPEIPALHLARKKVQLLQNLELGDRVSVLLNRSQKNALIGASQIQQLLGVPVYQEFPNDYRGVHNALTMGKEVEPNSELGKQFRKLANSVIDNPSEEAAAPEKKAKKKGFLSMLGLSPASAKS